MKHHLTVYSDEWLTSRTNFSFFWLNFLFNLLTNKGRDNVAQIMSGFDMFRPQIEQFL